MSLTNAFETALRQLIFQNANGPAGLGDATGLRGSATAGSFYIALFTADPGEMGSTAAEATFGGYARVAVARDGSSWTDDGSQIANAAQIAFAECSSGSNTITHAGIMTAASGGTMIAKGTAPLEVSVGITPRYAAGALTFSLE